MSESQLDIDSSLSQLETTLMKQSRQKQRI